MVGMHLIVPSSTERGPPASLSQAEKVLNQAEKFLHLGMLFSLWGFSCWTSISPFFLPIKNPPFVHESPPPAPTPLTHSAGQGLSPARGQAGLG